MAERLVAGGFQALPMSYTRARPAGDFSMELDDVRRARDQLLSLGRRKIAFVGRSFGGRICTRLAAVEPPTALVLLGHPISPPGRPRPADEAALTEVRCPTLIVQGEHDALGPLAVLQRIAASNPAIELYVVRGAGHQFGSRTNEAVSFASNWLSLHI